ERRDPAKSTLAAAKLLSALYQEFGDWYLAMAAYNSGSGRVRSAIRRTGSSNFWDLADSPNLPVETKNYVPKVLAALMLASNPSAHGFEVIADPMDVLPVTQVPLAKPASIQEIAQSFHINEQLLRHWNPELVNAITPPLRGGAPYMLRIAPHLTEMWDDVSMNLTYLDIKDVLMHKIRKGETLGSIASRYNINIKKLLNVNPGLRSGRLKVGSEVAVPTAYMTPKQRSSMTKRTQKSLRKS
ncbi:MAG: LysM peptidoglycan-binding domain-containing protein, partial [Proteobacteria bacterium]|nr:LysM peptidoglycan-binding domain-containing protein [Pseudomonadota bacterium]